MSAIISSRLMAAIVYWILVRDSGLAFRDGRFRPQPSADIMFWCFSFRGALLTSCPAAQQSEDFHRGRKSSPRCSAPEQAIDARLAS